MFYKNSVKTFFSFLTQMVLIFFQLWEPAYQFMAKNKVNTVQETQIATLDFYVLILVMEDLVRHQFQETKD